MAYLFWFVCFVSFCFYLRVGEKGGGGMSVV